MEQLDPFVFFVPPPHTRGTDTITTVVRARIDLLSGEDIVLCAPNCAHSPNVGITGKDLQRGSDSDEYGTEMHVPHLHNSSAVPSSTDGGISSRSLKRTPGLSSSRHHAAAKLSTSNENSNPHPTLLESDTKQSIPSKHSLSHRSSLSAKGAASSSQAGASHQKDDKASLSKKHEALHGASPSLVNIYIGEPKRSELRTSSSGALSRPSAVHASTSVKDVPKTSDSKAVEVEEQTTRKASRSTSWASRLFSFTRRSRSKKPPVSKSTHDKEVRVTPADSKARERSSTSSEGGGVDEREHAVSQDLYVLTTHRFLHLVDFVVVQGFALAELWRSRVSFEVLEAVPIGVLHVELVHELDEELSSSRAPLDRSRRHRFPFVSILTAQLFAASLPLFARAHAQRLRMSSPKPKHRPPGSVDGPTHDKLSSWTQLARTLALTIAFSPERYPFIQDLIHVQLGDLRGKLAEFGVTSIQLTQLDLPVTVDDMFDLDLERTGADNIFATEVWWKTEGLRIGITFEIRGRMMGVDYTLMLSVDNFVIHAKALLRVPPRDIYGIAISFIEMPKIEYRTTSSVTITDAEVRVPFQRSIEKQIAAEIRKNVDDFIQEKALKPKWLHLQQRATSPQINTENCRRLLERCESVTQYAFPCYNDNAATDSVAGSSTRPHAAPFEASSQPPPTQGDSTPTPSKAKTSSPRARKGSSKSDANRYDDTPFMGEAIAVLQLAEKELLARAHEIRARRELLQEALREQQHLVEARAKRLREERKQLEREKEARASRSKSKAKSSSGETESFSSRKRSPGNKFSFSKLFRLS